jgi:ribosomal protein S11
LVASAPTDPNKIVLHIQYVERGVAAFSDSQSGGRIASTGGGDTVGSAELEGSIWGARLQPVGLPWWKDCPGAQLILAAHGKMGFRCTANDVTTYVAENSWQSVDQKLEVRFNNGQFIYTFKLAPGRATASPAILCSSTSAVTVPAQTPTTTSSTYRMQRVPGFRTTSTSRP